MFVGISVSELLGWYEPVANIVGLFLIPLSLFAIVALPLLNLVWCYIDRAKFHNGLQYWVLNLFGMGDKFKTLQVNGKNIFCNDEDLVSRIFKSGGSGTVRVHVHDLRDVTKKGYARCLSDCREEKFSQSDVTETVSYKKIDDPRVAFLFIGAIVVTFAWPLFIIAASLFVPVYLLRAARDGQKLAVKVSKHIADKEAHNEGSADSSSSS
jgi:hypothetical protein